MSPKEFTSFRLDERLMQAMRDVRDNEGLPMTTQVELAVREWLQKRGAIIAKKPERKRASTRKRP